MMEEVGLPEMSLVGIASFVAATFMIFGGAVPYIPQYFEIKNSRNADGFSLYVCFALLVANIFRIMFWFGHPFELPLLWQSIVMIITMLVMIHVCTHVKNLTDLVPSRHHSFTDFDRAHFWNWSDFESYLQCICSIALFSALVTYAFLGVNTYVESLGFLAVFFEALLGAPQFYRNYKNSSTTGMSLVMVVCWLSGDVFKTIYFIIRSAPTQFWLCGILQICLDILIIGQVFIYGSQVPRTHKTAIQ